MSAAWKELNALARKFGSKARFESRMAPLDRGEKLMQLVADALTHLEQETGRTFQSDEIRPLGMGGYGVVGEPHRAEAVYDTPPGPKRKRGRPRKKPEVSTHDHAVGSGVAG